MLGTIEARYAERVRQGLIEADSAQRAMVARLDHLREALGEARLAQKSSPLGWLFSAKPVERPRGLYIWGDVGRGKTMLMDLFYECAPVTRKRRAHFHSFMADVHARIFRWREKHKQGQVKGDDPIAPVAAEIADEAWLLCFDEFAVTDIADAMILGRLFQALFKNGVVIAATSNVAPENLYRDGLNRALFLPFIGMLQDKMEVVRLEARADFRLEKLSTTKIWFSPDDSDAREKLDEIFFKLTGVKKGKPGSVSVFGRIVPVPEAAGLVARFDYDDLCRSALGSADFVKIARTYHSLVVTGIPRMNPEQRNQVKRFIVLIDALYDHGVKLIASAEAPPEELYPQTRAAPASEAGDYGGQRTEGFEFQRTASRMIEMQSAQYLARPHGSLSDSFGDSRGIVET